MGPVPVQPLKFVLHSGQREAACHTKVGGKTAGRWGLTGSSKN